MKRWIVLLGVGLALLGLSPEAAATEVGRGRNFGLGVAFGSPTSLVAKYFLSRENALDFGLGFWRYGNCPGNDNRPFCDTYRPFSLVSFNMDYLWQEPIVAGATASLDWHIGAGGRIWVGGGDFALAARMPVGLDLGFRKPSFLEVFLELAPAVYIVPGVYLDLEAFLGVRFYF